MMIPARADSGSAQAYCSWSCQCQCQSPARSDSWAVRHTTRLELVYHRRAVIVIQIMTRSCKFAGKLRSGAAPRRAAGPAACPPGLSKPGIPGLSLGYDTKCLSYVLPFRIC